MRVKNLTLAELEEKVIAIGFVDENLYTQVRIDCKELFDEHPDAIPSLAVQPPQGDAYPAVVTRDGDIVVWNVAKSDVQYANLGRLQLTFVIGEIVAKSYVGKYVIDKSLIPDGEAPTPIENWLTQAATALQALPQEVSNAVVALMGAMVGVGETLDPDDDVTVNYDAENNTLTIGVPKGKDGDPGHTPAITAKKVGKVVTFYVDGVAVVTVSDGTDGATGTTFTPSVSEEGVISWTNDGGKPNPAPRNIKGDPGKGVIPVFTRDMTSQTPDIWTCNMAWEDVEDAVNNGLCTTCKTQFINPYGTSENYLTFTGIHGDDEESIDFESTLTYDTEIRNMKISFHDTGTVEYTYDSFNVPQIDDEAGEGDTNKVYSASRVWADYSVMQENLGDLEDDVSDLKSQFASKADKTGTVLNTTLSRGRTPNSTVGDGSIAFGNMVEASGSQSVGFGSFIEAKGNQSFAHGYEVVARGARSSAGGYGTIAQGVNSDVSGMYNVADSYGNWPDWQPNTFYDAKAKVHLQVQSSGETYDYYYICKTPHTSGTTWDSHSSYWEYDNGYMNYAHIVGNGKDYRHRSNAYALDWEGNGHYAGDVYVGCNADGSGGVKLEPVVFATDAHTREIFATV